jgi:hypothetical protein
MSEQRVPYVTATFPEAGISRNAIRVGRFIDRLPKEGVFLITLEKIDNEWKIQITEIKVIKTIQEQTTV